MKSNATAPPRLGGQAVIEGVMVRCGDQWAAAARASEGAIVRHRENVPAWAGRARRVPVVRGAIALVATVALGMRALAWSRAVADGSTDETADGRAAKKNETGRVATAATIVSLALFVAVFAVAPALAARAVTGRHGGLGEAAVEAALRLALLTGYVAAIGRLPGIRRTFEYHGAEHQAIAAAEAGVPLDVEHVRRFSPRHARCGTDFLVLVAVVSIVAFALVAPGSWLALAVTRILLLPVVAGLAYEVLRVADGPVAAHWVRPLLLLGLAVQALTTRPPDDDQIEVAIAAVLEAKAAAKAAAAAT